jgi:hypothetical protein
LTFNLRHATVDRDAETLGALVVDELHVAVCFFDAADWMAPTLIISDV